MRVCAISFKECWRSPDGWMSSGGFPVQMAAIRSLFDEMTLLIVEVPPRSGGVPLPDARIVSMRQPAGTDFRRKLSVAANLGHYIGIMRQHIRTADVVHVPLPGDLPLVGMGVAVSMRRPVIARYCGSWAPTSETTTMNRITRAAMRLLARGSNVMLATGVAEQPPAPGMAWIFASALSARELAEISPNLDRGLSDPPRIAFIGRLSPEKGPADLLAALRQVQRRGRVPMPRVLLIGDGPLREQLAADIAQGGLEHAVYMTGQLDRRALSEQLATVDFCVQPSHSEGLCKAWVDAMAHGLPVLGSDVGAARAFIGSDRGWLVPPGDTSALVHALEAVLTIPAADWSELRRRCFRYVQSLTIELWAARIGSIAAEKLGFSFTGAKLGTRLS